jgi:uncharacterized protein (TIGR02996 family)
MREAFERAIVEAPDELSNHAAYADWLDEQGDPRGELIRVQLALEREGLALEQRSQLRVREKELLEAHQHDWLGGLAPFLLGPNASSGTFSFARGWLDELAVRLEPGLATALAKAPEARLLRALRILETERGALQPLTASPHLGNVRLFQLGHEDEHGAVRGALGDELAALVQRFPRIEELSLHSYARFPEELFSSGSLSNLRSLVVRGYCLDACEALANNPALRRLVRLSLDLGGWGQSYELPFEGCRALFRCRHLRRLTHLRLHRCENGDRLCRIVVRSPLLPRLMELGLISSRITIRGARVLAACEELSSLDLLDLSGNCLGRRGLNVLEAAGVNYQADDQVRPDDDLDDGIME